MHSVRASFLNDLECHTRIFKAGRHHCGGQGSQLRYTEGHSDIEKYRTVV